MNATYSINLKFMMRIAYILLFMFCTLKAVADPARVPVIVTANDGLDACMSMGAVHGLSPNGDGFLAVKSGPGTSFTRIDKITEGTYVYLCDFKKTKSSVGMASFIQTVRVI